MKKTSHGLDVVDRGIIRLLQQDGRASNVAEHVAPWSFLKFPYHRQAGWPQGFYRVGPLARLNVVDKIGTPLAEQSFRLFRQIGDGR